MPHWSLHNHIKQGSFFFFFLFWSFQGPQPWHMEVPRLGVELELQLPAYTRVTATRDLSHICDLHHSSRQYRIRNPLSEARDRTHNLMVPPRIRFRCATMGALRTLSVYTTSALDISDLFECSCPRKPKTTH